jgi:hypothetical protein
VSKSSPDGDELPLTVVEVVPLEDVPETIREMAQPALTEQGMSWRVVSCAARVRNDELRLGEQWLVAVHSTDVGAGSRLASNSRWAAVAHQYGVGDGKKQTNYWVDVVERVSGLV